MNKLIKPTLKSTLYFTLLILSFMLLNITLTACFPIANFLEFSSRIENVERKMVDLENSKAQKEDIVNFDSKLYELNNKLIQVDRKILEIQLEIERLEFVKAALSISPSAGKADEELVNYLNQRIQEVKNELSNIQNNTDSLKLQLDKNSIKTAEIEKKVTNLDTKISSLSNQMNDINNQISTLTKKMDDSQKNISNLSENLKKQESSLSQLNQTIGQINKRISDLEKGNSVLLTRIASVENTVKEIEIVKKDLDTLSSRVRKLQDLIPSTISTEDVEFLKQLQQQIQEIKSVIQSLSIEEFLKLKEGFIYYIVKSGDTLSNIAKAYNVKVNDLAQINNIVDPSKLAIGQVLKIPISNPSEFVRVPLKINPADILSYHGQPKGDLITVGLDIYARGKDIYPILPGKVLSVENDTIKIDHGNMIIAVYGGLQTSAKPGSFVSNNTPLGTCLDVFHFELYIEGEPRDPIRLFTEYKGVFVVTFYSEWDDGKVPNHPTFRIARNGKIPEQFKTIAVDPNVIPLGSLVYIPTLNNTIFIAEDTGSAIKGNRIDVYVSDVRLALNGGISPHPVYVFYPDKNSR